MANYQDRYQRTQSGRPSRTPWGSTPLRQPYPYSGGGTTGRPQIGGAVGAYSQGEPLPGNVPPPPGLGAQPMNILGRPELGGAIGAYGQPQQRPQAPQMPQPGQPYPYGGYNPPNIRDLFPPQTPGGPVPFGAFSQAPGTPAPAGGGGGTPQGTMGGVQIPQEVQDAIARGGPGHPWQDVQGVWRDPHTGAPVAEGTTDEWGNPLGTMYQQGGGDYGTGPGWPDPNYGFPAGDLTQEWPKPGSHVSLAGSDLGRFLLEQRQGDPIQQMLRQLVGQTGDIGGGFAGQYPQGMNWLQGLLQGNMQDPMAMYGQGGLNPVFSQMMQNMTGGGEPLELGMRRMAGGALGEAAPVAEGSVQQMLNLLMNPESLGGGVQTQIMNAARDVAAREGSASERQLAEAMSARGQADSGLQASLQRQGELQTGTDLGTLQANLAREGAIRRPEDIARAVGLAENLVGGRRGYGMDWANMAQQERGLWHQTGQAQDELDFRRGLGGQQYQLGLGNMLQNLFGQQAGLTQQGIGNMMGLMGQQYSDPYQMIQNALQLYEQTQAARKGAGGGGGGLGALGSGLGSLLGMLMTGGNPAGAAAANAGMGFMGGTQGSNMLTQLLSGLG